MIYKNFNIKKIEIINFFLLKKLHFFPTSLMQNIVNPGG